jgi:hypothetical protein
MWAVGKRGAKSCEKGIAKKASNGDFGKVRNERDFKSPQATPRRRNIEFLKNIACACYLKTMRTKSKKSKNRSKN